MKEYIVKKLMRYLPVITLVMSGMAFAESPAPQKTCKVDSMSFYYTSTLKSGEDIAALLQEKEDTILQLAKKNKVEGFKIMSQDASVSQNCCGSTELQLHVSYSVQYPANFKVFDAFVKESGSLNISSSRYETTDCPLNNE